MAGRGGGVGQGGAPNGRGGGMPVGRGEGGSGGANGGAQPGRVDVGRGSVNIPAGGAQLGRADIGRGAPPGRAAVRGAVLQFGRGTAGRGFQPGPSVFTNSRFEQGSSSGTAGQGDGAGQEEPNWNGHQGNFNFQGSNQGFHAGSGFGAAGGRRDPGIAAGNGRYRQRYDEQRGGHAGGFRGRQRGRFGSYGRTNATWVRNASGSTPAIMSEEAVAAVVRQVAEALRQPGALPVVPTRTEPTRPVTEAVQAAGQTVEHIQAMTATPRTRAKMTGSVEHHAALGMQGGILGRRRWGCRAVRGLGRRSRRGRAEA